MDPISRQIDERNRRIRLGLEPPPAPPTPPPKPRPTADDAEDDGPTYLSPAWHAARLAAEAKATAAPAPAPVYIPPAYRPENLPKRRKSWKYGNTPVGRARQSSEHSHIACEAKGCGLMTRSFARLCARHLHRRRRFGTTKLTRHPLHLEDYQHFLTPARRYLRRNRPEPAILEAMATFLRPADPIPFDRRGRKQRALLRQEMQRWSDPRARKKDKHHGRADYTTFGYLAHLVAVLACIEERESGFPDGADLHVLMRSVVLRHRRPARYVNGQRRALPVSASVVRGLITRWQQNDRADLSLFVAVAARAVLALVQEKREQKNRSLTIRRSPAVPPPTPPAEPKITPPAPPDPGPRPAGHAMESHVQEWAARFMAWERYTITRKEITK